MPFLQFGDFRIPGSEVVFPTIVPGLHPYCQNLRDSLAKSEKQPKKPAKKTKNFVKYGIKDVYDWYENSGKHS